MKKLIFTFILGVGVVSFLFDSPLFGQDPNDETCVEPQEIGKGQLASLYTYPYYPANATLKALVIFVKFPDDTTFDLSPHTDLWPRKLNTLPSWAPNIIFPKCNPRIRTPVLAAILTRCH